MRHYRYVAVGTQTSGRKVASGTHVAVFDEGEHRVGGDPADEHAAVTHHRGPAHSMRAHDDLGALGDGVEASNAPAGGASRSRRLHLSPKLGFDVAPREGILARSALRDAVL